MKSTVLRSVGYAQDEAVLEVEFTNREVYRYFVVPRRVYVALLASSNPGRCFNQTVRDRYPVRQVR